jgi:hypothetical protein
MMRSRGSSAGKVPPIEKTTLGPKKRWNWHEGAITKAGADLCHPEMGQQMNLR